MLGGYGSCGPWLRRLEQLRRPRLCPHLLDVAVHACGYLHHLRLLRCDPVVEVAHGPA
jgi:hypothetical protein